MDVRERSARLKVVIGEIDAIMREIGPKMVRMSHLRKEVRSIVEELRGDPEAQP